MIHRIVKLPKKRSFFLFGARGTGKSTLLRASFAPAQVLYIDLLNLVEQDRLARNPHELSEQIQALPKSKQWVIIDEIQKIPKLLDVVHSEIEKKKVTFALTGSSARKLKRGAANLLAGRAFVHSLFPLTHVELGENFDLEKCLRWGSLPTLLTLDSDELKAEYLRSYALTYLKEEIQEEQIIRNLDPFRGFLEVAAQCNGQILNFSKIADDVGTDTKSVQSYFQILEDTLLGFLLEPFHQSIRKRQRTSPKFYFFDPGVKRALERTLSVGFAASSYAYGNAFEHFVLLEAVRLNSYLSKDYRFSYLRTKDDAEIDLVVERPGAPLALVEIKSKNQITDRDMSTLKRFASDFPKADLFIWSQDPKIRKQDRIHILPWEKGLSEIGLIA